MKIPEPTKEKKDEKNTLRSVLGSRYNIITRKLGIKSIDELVMYTPAELYAEGLFSTLASAERFMDEVLDHIGAEDELDSEARRKYDELPRLSIGVKELDELLGAGFKAGQLYGVAGKEGAGKSRIAHQLSVAVQLPPINGKAIYIDAENTFSDDLIRRIAGRFDLDPREAVDNIIVVRGTNYYKVQRYIEKKWVKKIKEGYKLLVIDTIIGPFREILVGREFLAMRQQLLEHLLNKIREGLQQFNIYGFLTDHLLAVPDPSKGKDFDVAGGYVVKYGVNYWYIIYKTGADTRKFSAYDAPNRRTGDSAPFRITDYGLEDIE